jgi:spore germination protein YaaH
VKRLILLIILILLAGFFTFNLAKQKVKNDLSSPIPYPTTTITPSVNPDEAATGPEKTSLFVPYWTVKDKEYEEVSYDSYIYFGIVPTKDGIDTKEQGSLTLNSFLSSVPAGGKKLLALRMIERETNFAILKDQNAQKKIIAETLALAKEKDFDGVVLDLEISAIPFESLVSQINSFTELFYKETKKNNLRFSLAVYGDVFYRVRPFDVKTLAKHTDTVMIMAYDFSKAKGNPGPNFPLQGEDVYGYDYALLTKDFLSIVPPEKITVIFGLFGYDWVVDGQGRTLQQGKALSTREIESGFIENCQQRSCSFSRESRSFETQVNYVAKDGSKHIIWFEDMQSVEAKKEYLKTRGINSFSYWAHSYF